MSFVAFAADWAAFERRPTSPTGEVIQELPLPLAKHSVLTGFERRGEPL